MGFLFYFAYRLILIGEWLANINDKASSILLRTIASILWQFRKKEFRLYDVFSVNLIELV